MKRAYLIGLSCFAAFLLFAGYGFTAQSYNATASQSAAVSVGGGSAALIEQVCSQIYEGDFAGARGLVAVSYTHLTLPTSDLV